MTDEFWDRNERFRVWNQEVKVQRRGELKHDGNSALRATACSRPTAATPILPIDRHVTNFVCM